jgi:hypothetical protein
MGLKLYSKVFTKPVPYCDPQHNTSPVVAELAPDIDDGVNMLLVDAVNALENWKCTLAISKVVVVEMSIIS